MFIEELPSGIRPIDAVPTSITAFVGRTLRGPVNSPVRIQSFSDYLRIFGELTELSTVSYAVWSFFQNGGTDALVVRVHRNAARAIITLPASSGDLVLEAVDEGAWGNNLVANVEYGSADLDLNLFNLVVEELPAGSAQPAQTEIFSALSCDSASPRFVAAVLEQESKLVRVQGAVPSSRPNIGSIAASSGADGDPLEDAQIAPESPDGTGMYALDNTDIFNLLCIPPLDFGTDISAATRDAAASYCSRRRALFIVDPPVAWDSVSEAQIGLDTFMQRSKNAAAYFPRIQVADPLNTNSSLTIAPCGAVAGIMARTDAARGVWKAPAGLDASINGATGLSIGMTDAENGELNPLGLNCLRKFPVGLVVWGARTLEGADRLASEWKYVPVRRLALNIEESLFRGTQWVVFEPNNEATWAQIRLNVGAFMQNLFRNGAFQGQTPRDAYFVKCDQETTTQDDIERGVLNIVVGCAVLRPAEFVILKIQQVAGQTTA